MFGPKERVRYAISMLQDEKNGKQRPTKKFSTIYDDYLSHPTTEGRKPDTNELFSTWVAFETRLIVEYGNPNEKDETAIAIMKLTQTSLVASYTQKFQELMAQLIWDTNALKALYLRGLKVNL